MNTTSFTTHFKVEESPETIFGKIQNFSAWWSEDIEGNTDVLNEAFFYHYKDIHLCKIRLIEVIPNKKLTYEILENEFNFISDKTEWVGTKLVFELQEEDGKTLVTFTHKGLTPHYECYPVCNEAWTNYIQNSLFRLITTGKGNPNPKDKEGFNAHLAAKWNL